MTGQLGLRFETNHLSTHGLDCGNRRLWRRLDETRPASRRDHYCWTVDGAARRLDTAHASSFKKQRVNTCLCSDRDAELFYAVRKRAQQSTILDLNVVWK